MDRPQEQQALSGAQPIPLVQMLPDGRLAYVSLPMAPAPRAAPVQMMHPAYEAIESTTSRDRWARVVQVSGVVMLLLGVVGLAARLCLTLETKNAIQWTLWSTGLLIDTLSVIAGLLALRAGSDKTSGSARCYLRYLVFFAVLYVLATAIGSVVAIKVEMRKDHQHPYSQVSADFGPVQNLRGEPVTVFLDEKSEPTGLLEEESVEGPMTENQTPGEEEHSRPGDYEHRRPEKGDRHRPREDGFEGDRHGEEKPEHDRHRPREDGFEGDRHREEKPEHERRRPKGDGHRRHREDEPDQSRDDKPERREHEGSEEGGRRPEDREPEHGRRRHDEKRDRDDRRGHDRDEKRDRDDRRGHDRDEKRDRDDRREHDRDEKRDNDERHRRDRDEKRDSDERRRRHDRDEGNDHRRRHDERDRHDRHRRHFDNDDRPDWDDWQPLATSQAGETLFEEETALQSRRKNKYGDRDEKEPLTREEIEDVLFVGVFACVLSTICLCSCCVFCACRLLTHSEKCERFTAHYQQYAPYPYAQPQFAQPVMMQMAQQPPMQGMQQPVQAMPVASPAAYPNLAPVGNAVGYPR